ncbi:MAG: hypothetical protein QM811_12495 [Pirellulales bacterium]
MFTKALSICSRSPRSILKGALQRDECRGAHLQAGVRVSRDRHDGPSRTTTRSRIVVRSIRSEYGQVVEEHDRRERLGRRADSDL